MFKKCLKRRPSFRRIGFTLIELLVVIAIIAVLIALLMCPSDTSPVFSTYDRVDAGVGPNQNSGPKLSYFGNIGDNHNDDQLYWPFQSLPIFRENGYGEAGTLTGIMNRDGRGRV